MLNPLEYPLIDDLVIISVGTIFRIEELHLTKEICLNVVAKFTGLQRRDPQTGSVSIQVIILSVYEPSGTCQPSGLDARVLWVENLSLGRNVHVKGLMDLIDRAANPRVPEFLS